MNNILTQDVDIKIKSCDSVLKNTSNFYLRKYIAIVVEMGFGSCSTNIIYQQFVIQVLSNFIFCQQKTRLLGCNILKR